MIIDQIDVERVPVLETEDDAPGCSHRYRPEASEIAAQTMQSEAMDVDVFDFLRNVQKTQNVLDLLAAD
jgi:hypothetical protein